MTRQSSVGWPVSGSGDNRSLAVVGPWAGIEVYICKLHKVSSQDHLCGDNGSCCEVRVVSFVQMKALKV